MFEFEPKYSVGIFSIQKFDSASFLLSFASIIFGISVLYANSAHSASTPHSYFYPRVNVGADSTTTLIVINVGAIPATIQMSSYSSDGKLGQQSVGGSPLLPGERRAYSQETGAWPAGTASLKVESDGAVLNFLMVEGNNGKKLEAIPPTTDPATVLTFPILVEGKTAWTEISVLNAGSGVADLEIVALDPDGIVLARKDLTSISAAAGITVNATTLFDAAVIDSTAVIQIYSSQRLAGVQLFGSDSDSDFAALSAPLSEGNKLVLPVFTEGGGTPLWTQIGLFNPRDGPVHIDIEALDAQQQSLGQLTDISSLPPTGSQIINSANISGSLPSEVAFPRISAERAINVFPVGGSMAAKGVTVLQALSEKDHTTSYQIVDSSARDPLTSSTVTAQLRSFDLAGSSNGDALAVVAAVGPPTVTSPGTSTDTGFTVSNLTPTFTWIAVGGASNYGLFISKEPYGSANIIYQNTSLTGTTFVLPNGWLGNNTKYRSNMTSVSRGVESVVSNTLYFKTPAGPPTITSPGTSTDTGFTVSTLTPTFNWNGVAGASNYGLFISKEPYGAANIIYSNTSRTGTSFVLPGGWLINNTKYRWNMTSFSGGVESSVSNTLYFKTPGSPPGSFTVSGNPYCNTSPPGPSPAVMLNWTSSSGATSYDLYRNGSLYASNITGTTFDNNALGGVVAGQTYTYHVVAKNGTGNTQSNTIYPYGA